MDITASLHTSTAITQLPENQLLHRKVLDRHRRDQNQSLTRRVINALEVACYINLFPVLFSPNEIILPKNCDIL